MKRPIGTTAAAQANVPRGSAGKQSKAPSNATDAAQAKSLRGSHGEQADAPNGAQAAVQAIGPGRSDGDQAKAPRSVAAEAQEDIPSEAVVVRWRSLWCTYKWYGKAGAQGCLFRVLPPFCPFKFLPTCVGGRGYKRLSTLAGGA